MVSRPRGRTTNALTLGHPSVLPAILEHRQFVTGSAKPVQGSEDHWATVQSPYTSSNHDQGNREA
jgi:hypothetical protein